MEKLALEVSAKEKSYRKGKSSCPSASLTDGLRVPWMAAFVLFSISCWGFLGWRHLDLEWRVGRLEGELEARLDHRLQQLGLTTPTPSAAHSRVARQAPVDGCICPPGECLLTPRSVLGRLGPPAKVVGRSRVRVVSASLGPPLARLGAEGCSRARREGSLAAIDQWPFSAKRKWP